MPAQFDLIIATDNARHSAEFRLLDAHGVQLAYRHTDFKTLPASQQFGLFDLRNYLRHYAEPGQETLAVDEIGVCIAETVLGEDIFKQLWQSTAQRTLQIQLPGAGETENDLAAALARVPWEIAKPAAKAETLGERNLLLRIVHDRQAPPSPPLELAEGKDLRVLFVFAEAKGSTPLGMRQERLALQALFAQEIYPNRRVVAHVLSHGVTRARLIDQLEQEGGYHIVHWSGHGHRNLLELAKPGGGQDLLSGEEFLALFNQAGGFLPQLVFLSACHSGDILRVKDWDDFIAVNQGQTPGAKELDGKDLDLQTQPGYTGTAHALLQGGVPSVVAMRYAVGDDYARDLGLAFYRALLAHAQPKSAAAALTSARKDLANPGKHTAAHYAACDHATPVLYGAEQSGVKPPTGRSPALNPRDPRLHRIAELGSASHPHFVGRTWELAGLGANFIGAGGGTEIQPVAVVTGLGGMGKTALVAEALALWEQRFDWVLLYQAKPPNSLGFDATLRDIDRKLAEELGRYHAHVQARPADAIYRDASAEFTGPARQQRLLRNLVRALQDEAILLVLDNFETHLKPQPETGAAAWACQDPAWDACLQTLAAELPGSRSRVLLTCRRPLSALAGSAYVLPLGPLPAPEAALYLRFHPALNRMLHSADGQEQRLARRVLNASRFHPLLLDRLARLAAAGRRAQLLQALDSLEKRQDFAQLPALFAATPGDAAELAYLNDALETSLDQLIRDASPDARRMLWMLGLANEPVALDRLQAVWSGEGSPRQAQLLQIKRWLENLPELSPELQEYVQSLPAEIRAEIAALAEPPERPELEPLLDYLLAVGLVTEQSDEPDDDNPVLLCHELVRERIRAWMEAAPQDLAGESADAVRLAYADWLAAAFKNLMHQDMSAALQAGSQAIVYCVQAQAWERLGDFASGVVTSAHDPRLLQDLLPHLQTAADAAPTGRPRWSCLGYLADALGRGGLPDASLVFYQPAATQARATAEAGGDAARQAWADLAWISGNWANTLLMTGQLDAARQRRLDAAEAYKQAGRPLVYVLGSELEALRLAIMQGEAATALPEIEARLAQIAGWWRQHRAGQPVDQAPDAELLARVYISALDIAMEADYAREDWASALTRLDAVLETKRALQRPAEDIGGTRFNRATVLMRLGRLGEAQAELEACLSLFQHDPAMSAKTLGSLADLFNRHGDSAQAVMLQRRALALCERLPDPLDRALSHNNLAEYLDRLADPAAQAESARHQLAALIYRFVAGLGQDLQQLSLHNYAIRFRRARAAGAELAVPAVAELLTAPAFHPLAEWLAQRGVDPAELQAAVDQFLAQASRSG